MPDINGIKIEPNINLTFGKNGAKASQGGDGGQIFIFAEEVKGGGIITTDGGDGEIAGKGGNVFIQSKRNNFKGNISAKGGKQLK